MEAPRVDVGHRRDAESTIESAARGRMGAWAPYYDLLMKFLTVGREGALRRLTLELAAIRPGARVLEVGCGTGTLTLAAQKCVGSSGETHGIDAAPEMVAVARRKGARTGSATTFREGLIEKIPYPDSTFDLVLCSFMIFHVPDDVRQQGLREIHRVLKPQGRLFIMEMGKPDFPSLRQSMTEAGFTDMFDGRRKLLPVPWPLLYLRAVARKELGPS